MSGARALGALLMAALLALGGLWAWRQWRTTDPVVMEDVSTFVDQNGDVLYQWLAHREQLGEEHLPLLERLLLGRPVVGPEGEPVTIERFKHDVIDAFRHLTERGVAVRTGLFADFLLDPEVTDSTARRSAAQLFATLPVAAFETEKLLDVLRAEPGRDDGDAEVAGNLLTALARKAAAAGDGERDRLTTELEQLAGAGLRELVGPVSMTYAIGGIGGPLSADAVIDFYERGAASHCRGAATADRVGDCTGFHRRWALGALAGGGTPQGLDVVRHCVRQGCVDEPWLRELAITWLARFPFTDAEGDLLRGLAADADLDGRLRAAAVDALAYFVVSGADAGAATRGAVRSRLESLATVTDPGVRAAVQAALARVDVAAAG